MELSELLAGWLASCLAGCLPVWLTGWLAGCDGGAAAAGAPGGAALAQPCTASRRRLAELPADLDDQELRFLGDFAQASWRLGPCIMLEAMR